jgi:hypothetical protein
MDQQSEIYRVFKTSFSNFGGTLPSDPPNFIKLLWICSTNIPFFNSVLFGILPPCKSLFFISKLNRPQFVQMYIALFGMLITIPRRRVLIYILETFYFYLYKYHHYKSSSLIEI